MKDLITTYSAAIAARRGIIRGTVEFTRADDALRAAFTDLVQATGLTSVNLTTQINAAELAYAEDPTVAGSVTPGNAYPEDFIDRLAATLSAA